MSKEQFFKELEQALQHVSIVERQEIIQDYEEYFTDGLADGKTEEEILASLGSPKQIAKELMVTVQLEKAESSATVGNVFRAVWAVIGLGFFNLVIVLGPFIAIVGIVLSGWITALAFIISPFMLIFQLVMGYAGLFEFFQALALCGLGIFIFIGMFFATKALTAGFVRYLKFNASLVKGGLKRD